MSTFPTARRPAPRLATARDCVCCGARSWRTLYEGIIRCQRCGYQRMLEELTLADLQDIYTEKYYTGEKYHDYPAEKDMIQANFRERLKAMARYVGRDAAAMRLFEIGSAYGFFLEVARPLFASVQGYDIAVEATAHARDALGLDVGTGDVLVAPLETGAYDVVCMWDTIEHLSTPEAYVQRAWELLAPGGLLFITTGDVDSMVARLQKRKWRLYDPPQHVHYFSPQSLGCMLFQMGYRVLGVETCAFIHSVEQIVHGLGFYNDQPGVLGRLCRWLYPRLPGWVKRIRFPIDLRDIFMIVAQKP